MKLPEWETAYQKAVKTEAACRAACALGIFIFLVAAGIYVIWCWIPQAQEIFQTLQKQLSENARTN